MHQMVARLVSKPGLRREIVSSSCFGFGFVVRRSLAAVSIDMKITLVQSRHSPPPPRPRPPTLGYPLYGYETLNFRNRRPVRSFLAIITTIRPPHIPYPLPPPNLYRSQASWGCSPPRSWSSKAGWSTSSTSPCRPMTRSYGGGKTSRKPRSVGGRSVFSTRIS